MDMTIEEWLFSPWNERKIQYLIEQGEKQRQKEEKAKEEAIESRIKQFKDIDASIEFLGKQIEENHDNEWLLDQLYKEIPWLYEQRRKKIINLHKLGIMNNISARDSKGGNVVFDVTEEPINVKGLDGIYYQIRERNKKDWKHFIFKVLFTNNDEILIYQLSNQDILELSNKGIVRAMIEALRLKYNKTIISSTNKEELKIDETEGRVPNVTTYWNKWKSENDKISYDAVVDRFIYEI